MRTDVVDVIQDLFGQEGMLMGVARADAINATAPEGFRPRDLMPGAKSVIVFARQLPFAVYLAPRELNNAFYQRSAYTHYIIMDGLANRASLLIQDAGHLALPVPSYSPLRFHEGEPKGVMSLKHAAAAAGLGKLGRNSLLINKEHGITLRLGALMTDMEWPGYSSAADFEPCPGTCHVCELACPIGAIKDGKVNKIACLGKCISHLMLPPSFMLPAVKKAVAKSRMLTRFMERVSLNFFETYGISCTACLTSCPHFLSKEKYLRKK